MGAGESNRPDTDGSSSVRWDGVAGAGEIEPENGDDAPVDEATLRQAAEAGDVVSAYRLGVLLLEQEQFAEAEAWLRPVVHSEHGGGATFYLGIAAEGQQRPHDAEHWWSLAAHAGNTRAAYNLAGLLTRHGRHDEAGHWYRTVADSDDILALDAAWQVAERRVDDAVRLLVRREDGPALWELLLSRPVAEAVGIARHLRDLSWQPDGEQGRALAQRLAAADRELIAEVADRASGPATTILPFSLENVGAGSAERTTGEPMLALASIELASDVPAYGHVDRLRHRLRTRDRAGGQNELAVGTGSHSSFGILSDGTIIAVRDASYHSGNGSTFGWEVVRYGPEGEHGLGSGTGAPFPRVVVTRYGFVLGVRMTTEMFVGGMDGSLVRSVDLSAAGVRTGTDCLAADQTGTRIAFADDHVLVVADAQLETAIAAADPAQVGGRVEDLVFTSPDTVVSCGSAGICKWIVRGDQLVPKEITTTRFNLADLFAVPAWGVVAGRANGPNLTFFDIDTLEPTPPPRPIVGRKSRLLRTMNAAPGGRFVVYSGQLLVNDDRYDESYDEVTAIYDTRHPLACLDRPLSALTRTDLQQMAAVLAGEPPEAGEAVPSLSGDERQALELVHEVCAYTLAGTAP